MRYYLQDNYDWCEEQIIMNSLFSIEELKNLYRSSLYVHEMIKADDFYHRQEIFIQKADAVFATFGEDKVDSFLFGNTQNTMPIRWCFLPLFGYIRNRFAIGYYDWFCQGAFDEWEEAFCAYLEQLFGNMVFALLEEEVGEMTTPSVKWYEERACSFINSGKLYKVIARKYPLCARQLVEFTDSHAKHAEEIIDAVKRELPGLYDSFFPNGEMPKIKKVSSNSSDRHNGGRSVHILTFENGEKIVYKPHNLKMDCAWKQWLDYCADKSGISRFVFPVCRDTSRGGFCSFIKPKPLLNDDASEYFYRIGFLIGMVFLTGGGDLHCENIIAVDSDPVFIDTETLLEPKSCLLNRIILSKSKYSVINMCILPMMLSFPGLKEAEYAGLCYSMPGSNNLPIFAGKTVSAREYAEEVSNGFSLAIHTVTDNIDEAALMFKKCFEKVPLRSVIRGTAGYMKILSGLCNSVCQSNPAQYNAILDRMKFNSAKISTEDINWINREEAEALDRLDIPYFSESMTLTMLDDVISVWKEIREDDIKREEDRLFFGLTKAGPKYGLSVISKEKSVHADDFARSEILKGMRRQAKELEGLLTKKKTPVAVASNQDDYLVNKALVEVTGVLEGNLGVMMSLAAFCAVEGRAADSLRDELLSKVELLLNPRYAAPALTAGELSISSGGAGYLLGCYFLFQMEILSEEQFIRAVHNLDQISENMLKVKYSKYMTIYGSYDIIYAINKIPKKYVTDTLCNVKKTLLQEIGNKYTEKQICEMVENDLYQADSSMTVLANNTLRFGNAGKLMRYTTEKKMNIEEEEYASNLALYLSKTEHVLNDVFYPEGYLETGFIHGMPGVLYSLCRYMAPDSVVLL